MTNTEKLEFIKDVVSYRFAGYMGPGCPADWFHESYRDHKDDRYKKLPKYVVFAPNEEQLEKWDPCILVHNKDSGFVGYAAVGPRLYRLKDEIENKEYSDEEIADLLSNKKLPYSDGELISKITDEDYYIDKMYRISKNYYKSDIEPMLKDREDKIQMEKNRHQAACKMFGLSGY
jgi:hypothetical protein